jgi:hypothetical protein
VDHTTRSGLLLRVPITSRDGFNNISHTSWQILEPLEQGEVVARGQMSTVIPSVESVQVNP